MPLLQRYSSQACAASCAWQVVHHCCLPRPLQADHNCEEKVYACELWRSSSLVRPPRCIIATRWPSRSDLLRHSVLPQHASHEYENLHKFIAVDKHSAREQQAALSRKEGLATDKRPDTNQQPVVIPYVYGLTSVYSMLLCRACVPMAAL